MGIYFCGYDGNTKFKEIRDDFKYGEEKRRAIVNYIKDARKYGYAQYCDTLFYIILNDIDDYWKEATSSKDNGTCNSNIVRGVYGERHIQRIKQEDLILDKDSSYTLDRLRRFFENDGIVTSSYGKYSGTEIKCKDKDKILEILIPSKRNERNNQDAMTNNQSSNIMKIIKDALKNNKPVIFTGAPGTGKTYSVTECVEELVNKDKNRMEFVQFHPSYDYSDFVEGLRPMQNDGKAPTFVRMDGIFKAFCRKIVEENIKLEKYDKNTDTDKLEETAKPKLNDYYFVIDEINRADISRVFGELMFGLEESYRGKRNSFKTQYQNLPTYSYNKEERKYKEIENDCFENGFYIPENLHVIGTMNDIDRSVESFDFAMRRRFRWIDVKANDIMLTSLESMLLSEKNQKQLKESQINQIKENLLYISDRIIAMNDIMTSLGAKYGLNESYHIGPAYFKSYDGTEEKMKEIFDQGIEPIIREYMRGRDKMTVDQLVKECKSKLLESENSKIKIRE